MKNLLLVTGMLFSSVVAAADQPQLTLGQVLQATAVTIRAGGAHGSGVVFLKNDTDGNRHTFVLTAAHVVDGLRKQGAVLAPDGSTRQGVTFQDASIIRIIVEEGRKIGQLELYAKIIRYSPI